MVNDNSRHYDRSKTLFNSEVDLVKLYIDYKEEMGQLAKIKPNCWSIHSITTQMCCSSNKDPTTSALFTSQLEQPLSLTSNFINTVNNSNENTNTSNNTSNNNLFTPIRRFSYLCNDSPSPIDEASLEEHMLQFNGTENNNKVLKPTTPNNTQTTRKKTKLYNSTNPLSFSNNNTTFLQEKEGLNNIKTKESLSNGSKRKSVMSSPSTSSSTINSLVMVISTPLEIKQEIDQKEAKERSGLKRKRGRPKKVN